MYVLKEYVVQQKVNIFFKNHIIFCMHLNNKKKPV